MEQYGNNVNRLSGAHLINDQNHMGEIIDRLQNNQQAQVEQSSTQQQGNADRNVNRQNETRTRQSY